MNEHEASEILHVRLPVMGTDLEYAYSRWKEEIENNHLLTADQIQARLQELEQAYQTLKAGLLNTEDSWNTSLDTSLQMPAIQLPELPSWDIPATTQPVEPPTTAPLPEPPKVQNAPVFQPRSSPPAAPEPVKPIMQEYTIWGPAKSSVRKEPVVQQTENTWQQNRQKPEAQFQPLPATSSHKAYTGSLAKEDENKKYRTIGQLIWIIIAVVVFVISYQTVPGTKTKEAAGTKSSQATTAQRLVLSDYSFKMTMNSQTQDDGYRLFFITATNNSNQDLSGVTLVFSDKVFRDSDLKSVEQGIQPIAKPVRNTDGTHFKYGRLTRGKSQTYGFKINKSLPSDEVWFVDIYTDKLDHLKTLFYSNVSFYTYP